MENKEVFLRERLKIKIKLKYTQNILNFEFFRKTETISNEKEGNGKMLLRKKW